MVRISKKIVWKRLREKTYKNSQDILLSKDCFRFDLTLKLMDNTARKPHSLFRNLFVGEKLFILLL